ncbi:MAG TPA: hypothetical protein VG796_22100 [Verrucomicrobiales bacterium]|nr:hypothetical protein [Verrucomicrobiales bacterium]
MPPPSAIRPASWLPVFAASIAGGWMLGYHAPEPLTPAARASRSGSAASTSLSGKTVQAIPDTPASRWVTRVKKAGLADFPALFAEVDAIFPEYEDRETALRFLFGEWINRDAKAAVAFAGEQDDRYYLQSTVMDLMMRAWPEKAAEILFSGEDGILSGNGPALRDLAVRHPEIYLKMDPGGKRRIGMKPSVR